jgi:hypothetical protein
MNNLAAWSGSQAPMRIESEFDDPCLTAST